MHSSWLIRCDIAQPTTLREKRSRIAARYTKPVRMRMYVMSATHTRFGAWLNLRRRARGQIDFRELGRRLGLHESGDLGISYIGYAARRAG